MKSLKYQHEVSAVDVDLDKFHMLRSFGAKSFKQRKAARKTASASRKANRT